MTADFLVDTNILVYLYDRSEAEKQHKAELVVDRLLLSGRGALSTQVMAEFFNAVTRRLKEPLPLELAYLSLQNYQKSWSIVNMTPAIVVDAARGVLDHQLSFWDALIWATAKLNQIPFILSEDFRSGTSLEGVQFINPLSDEFDINAWLD